MTRSAGAVYFALIVLMLACISIGNLLYAKWQIPRYLTQPILYGLIAICGLYLYRRHFVCFRYTLTDAHFAIEQVGGNKEKTIAVVMIRDIRQVAGQAEAKNLSGHKIDASLPPSKTAAWVLTVTDGVEIAYRISASEAFLDTMKQQMHKRNPSSI
jgi:hypothetical protein